MSLNDLYSSLKRICEKVEGKSSDFSSSSSQIDYILTNFWDFKRDFKEIFIPAIENEVAKSGKSFYNAVRYKQFYDVYKNMAEPQFAELAFDSLNKAILVAPMELHNPFLRQCFSSRSNMHLHRENYQDALKDIDHAIDIRVSYSVIERKVAILEKLNRLSDAFSMISNILQEAQERNVEMNSDRTKLLKKLKHELKKYKPDGTKQEIVIEDKVSNFIKVTKDPRVSLEKNMAQRYSFMAKEAIPANTEILSEEPTMFSLRSKSMFRYCIRCRSKVANTFWPCANCTQAVFCSKKCADSADAHKMECGLISFMQKKLCHQTLQAYRTFIKVGMASLQSMYDKAENFSLEKSFEKCAPIIDKSQAFEWFFLSQIQMNAKTSQWKPLRQANEICNGIMLFMIYCYKMRINIEELSKNDLIQSIDFLTTTIVKTQLNEYSWNEVSDTHEAKTASGNFQCLFGSTINHNCEANAVWSFDGKVFSIKTLKDIDKEEEIAITYGVSKDLSVVKRQRHLQNFFIMCSCTKCLVEVRKIFAIRCNNCNGPIPYDSNEFANDICMICERRYENLSTMNMIQNEFQSAKKAIYMIGQINDEDLLKKLEKMVGVLASYIYLESEQFAEMACKLCERYFQLNMWSYAIEWYQWFVDSADIHLASSKDPFLNHIELDKWTKAYVEFLEHQVHEDKEISVNYVETAAYLFEKQFTLLDQLTEQCDLKIFDKIQMKKLFKSSSDQTQKRYYRFKEICKKILITENFEELDIRDDGTDNRTFDENKSSCRETSASFELSTTQ